MDPFETLLASLNTISLSSTVKAIKSCLSKDFKLNRADLSVTPLRLAIFSGRLNAVEWLLEAGADPNAAGTCLGDVLLGDNLAIHTSTPWAALSKYRWVDKHGPESAWNRTRSAYTWRCEGVIPLSLTKGQSVEMQSLLARYGASMEHDPRAWFYNEIVRDHAELISLC